jgi:hypothetical protein
MTLTGVHHTSSRSASRAGGGDRAAGGVAAALREERPARPSVPRPPTCSPWWRVCGGQRPAFWQRLGAARLSRDADLAVVALTACDPWHGPVVGQRERVDHDAGGMCVDAVIGGPLLRLAASSCFLCAAGLLALGDAVSALGVAGCGLVCWIAAQLLYRARRERWRSARAARLFRRKTADPSHYGATRPPRLRTPSPAPGRSSWSACSLARRPSWGTHC